MLRCTGAPPVNPPRLPPFPPLSFPPTRHPFNLFQGRVEDSVTATLCAIAPLPIPVANSATLDAGSSQRL